jgi:hypothetical protein
MINSKKKFKEYVGLTILICLAFLLGISIMTLISGFSGFSNNWFFIFGVLIFMFIFIFKYKDNFYKWWMKIKFQNGK